jgi:hypothetical protein
MFPVRFGIVMRASERGFKPSLSGQATVSKAATKRAGRHVARLGTCSSDATYPSSDATYPLHVPAPRSAAAFSMDGPRG